MQQSEIVKLAIAGGIIFAAYKYGNPMIRGATIAIAAVAVARRVPYVKDVI